MQEQVTLVGTERSTGLGADVQRDRISPLCPHHDDRRDCIRFENGIDVLGPRTNPQTGVTTPRQTCKAQFESGLRGVVTSIRDRRFVAVDRARGIVFAFAFFDHRPINWTWQLGELFKVEKGQIRRIEAVFIRGPYGIPSGWSTYEQGRSEQIQDVR